MTSSSMNTTTFLNLPREIRDQIYELVFFSGEHMCSPTAEDFEQRKLNWASDGLARTAKNQIHPYRRNSKHQPSFNLAILRVNHRLEEEAARVFYGWSSFNLTMDYYGPGNYYKTYEFLQSLPRKYRQLLRRIEHRCYDEYLSDEFGVNNRRSMLPFDWNALMKFLAQECPSLQSLILWGFADGRESKNMEKICREDSAWVQAVLQIKTLTFFNIPAIPRHRVKLGQSCMPEFLEKMRASLYNQETAISKSEPNDEMMERASSFPFLKLPIDVRNRVYRFALLPANKQLHPYIKPWYDNTTKNTIPIFLTCHQIHKEAEEVLYRQGVLCIAASKYHYCLCDNFWFPKSTAGYHLDKFRSIRVYDYLFDAYFRSFLRSMSKLEKLYYVLDSSAVHSINREWRADINMDTEICDGKLKLLVVETLGTTELDPRALCWFKRLVLKSL